MFALTLSAALAAASPSVEPPNFVFTATKIHDFKVDDFANSWKKKFTAATCTTDGGSTCDQTWAGIQPTAIMEAATTIDNSGLSIVLKGEDASSAAVSAFAAANALEGILDTNAETCDCEFRDSTTGMIQSYGTFGPGSLIETRFKVTVIEQNPGDNAQNATGKIDDVVASIWLQSMDAEISFGVRANEIVLGATSFGSLSTGTPEESVISMGITFDATSFNDYTLWWNPETNEIVLYVNQQLVGSLAGQWTGGISASDMLLMADLQIDEMSQLDNVALSSELLITSIDVYTGAAPTLAPTAAPTSAPTVTPTPAPPKGVCKSWCYANVKNKKDTIAEVCAFATCKGCDSFPGSTETCVSKNPAPTPPAASAGVCKSWCYANVKNKKDTIASVCTYTPCKGCDSFPGSTETCVSKNPAPTPTPTPPPASAAVCKPWCYTNVESKTDTIAEVCAFAACKGCDSFPGSTETCVSKTAAPTPTPPPASAAVCKPWCTPKFTSGKDTKATLCSYAACQGCDFGGSTCTRRRARWIQPCDRMSAIECMKAVVDGQCNLRDDVRGKSCIETAEV